MGLSQKSGTWQASANERDYKRGPTPALPRVGGGIDGAAARGVRFSETHKNGIADNRRDMARRS